MSAREEESVVATLLAYLDGAEEHGRGWALRAEPLRQEVCVRSDQWRTWATEASLADGVRPGVDAALEQVAAAGDVVNRSMLTAASAAIDATAPSLVAAWFLVMCWGAGPRKKSRLRQWTRALHADDVIAALARSRQLFDSGELTSAYGASKLPGVAESYLTKWLWMLGLPEPTLEVRPYVLDIRVWASLRLLPWKPSGGNHAERWVEYCRSLDRWAEALNGRRPGWAVDGDRIEQLLFDRLPGMHLCRWLQEREDPGVSSRR